jgi:cell division protein FtsQ
MKLLRGTKKQKWLQLTTAGILLLAVVSGLVMASGAEGKQLVKNLDIRITPDTGLYFITPRDVVQALAPDGSAYKGKTVASLHLDRLEAKLQEHPYVAACEVHADLSGNIQVRIRQKNALLRIINKTGQSYYLGENGQKLPFSNMFTPNVPVATGYIEEQFQDSAYPKTPVLKQLQELAAFLNKHPMWAAQIEQVYVDNFSEFLLIPRVGNHSIVLGTCEQLEEKMEKLRIFYTKALPSVGWDHYSKINLSYRGQVVATRRNAAITSGDLNEGQNNEQNTGQ